MVGVMKNTVGAVLAGEGTMEPLDMVGREGRTNSRGVSCEKKSFSTTISASTHIQEIASQHLEQAVPPVDGHGAPDLERRAYNLFHNGLVTVTWATCVDRSLALASLAQD